jgi:light-regulated signal transduction histidine kinase (bacteriophytochrome)
MLILSTETESQIVALEETQLAILNILEDAEDEKVSLRDTQKAVINILEDYSVEKVRMEKMNSKLISSNKEVEQFAYIASHDLQEPLKTISNYAGLLSKKYKESSDKEVIQYLTVINKATSRMQLLIKDLLDYSRVGNDKTKVQIDCNILLNELKNDMEQSITESGAEVSSEKLPVITGYLSGIKSLFQNLISNAIKFRRRDGHPLIQFTIQSKEKEWLFAVKDDGIGIEKIYYGKLFVIFQRLHSREEYSGTGIGLAQCKKIVEQHGGIIWVESEFGKGSTFYFTIPKTIQ